MHQQHQQTGLKSCGDHKPPVSSSSHRRGGGGGGAKKTNGGNNRETFLATDVTTLDINTFFQSKKSKRNGNGAAGSFGGVSYPTTAPSTPTSTNFPFLGSQSNNFQFPSYISPSVYANFDLFAAAAAAAVSANGDHLPSLMSVPAFKPPTFAEPPVMDFAQFTEELNAIQQNHHHHNYNHQNTTVHPLFTSSTTDSQQHFGPKSPTSSFGGSPSSSARIGGGGRKNRMVEMKTINDRSVVVVSDPQSAAVTTRQQVVQLKSHGFPMDAPVENPKQKIAKQISSEPIYSRKVFIGGLPIDVTEEEVWTTFGAFGKVLVDWPRRPEHASRGDFYDHLERRNARSVSGYVFLVFTDERSVQELVNACEFYEDKYYLQLSSPTMSDKAVQVRAWRLSDIDYFCDENSLVDHRRTVFIGGVPRPTRASDLARALQDHYGKVSYVGIDIDPELKYPKGAARVTFSTSASFVSAISGRFVNVMHAESNKRVEIKPYIMEDQYCDECLGVLCKHNYASYFCGDASCLQYYCEACWDRMHYYGEEPRLRADHRPMVRTGDQTKVLSQPPHHHRHHQPQPSTASSAPHYQHQNHHHHHQPHQHQHQHHQHRLSTTSTASEFSPSSQKTTYLSRILNRNNNNAPSSSSSSVVTSTSIQKPFAAVPTTIGY